MSVEACIHIIMDACEKLCRRERVRNATFHSGAVAASRQTVLIWLDSSGMPKVQNLSSGTLAKARYVARSLTSSCRFWQPGGSRAAIPHPPSTSINPPLQSPVAAIATGLRSMLKVAAGLKMLLLHSRMLRLTRSPLAGHLWWPGLRLLNPPAVRDSICMPLSA